MSPTGRGHYCVQLVWVQMTKQTPILFIYGFGFTADHLLPLICSNWRLFASTRSETKAKQLRRRNVEPIIVSETVQDGLSALDQPFHVLITAPPQTGTCPAFRDLNPLHTKLTGITYLSTTGVYGDHSGGWVYEDTPTSPQSARASARVQAEEAWEQLALQNGIPFRTVRLPGIYGPGRSAFDRLLEGRTRRIIKVGQVFSRIHVDDIARGLAALLDRSELDGVFHLCDEEAAPPQDVIAFAAELLGMDVPPDIPFDSADLSPMARSFYAECKRVSNVATKQRLDWAPEYPTYRDGLAAILAEMKKPQT